nr:META domain protein [uncultured bacterium]AMP55577.1 META domain protein [uncultured bacterium]AMP55599.1 META domain protein [uncultured bacterium]
MMKIKFTFVAVTLLVLVACSTGNKATESDENIQLDSVGLQGEWQLQSYRVDCESTEFENGSKYKLNFDEPYNSFSLSTDCNMINGEFGITNDTIRFKNMLVTEMACDNMTVEENMLRLLNDSTAYATYSTDTLRLIAPQIGSDIFVNITR